MKQALGPDFCTAVKYTPGPGLNSVILVVVSEVHVGTNLNSAVTEVPTKRRRRGTVWHHRGGAHGTTAAPRRHYGGGAHVPELSKGHCCLGCMQVVFRNGLVERILSFVRRGKNSCPNFWLNGHLKFCTVS